MWGGSFDIQRLKQSDRIWMKDQVFVYVNVCPHVHISKYWAIS